MLTFLFYISAICLLFAVCAALADGLGHLFPDWQAEADESLEDAQATEGKVT